MMAAMKLLREGLQELGFTLTDAETAQFGRYQELLLEWNQRFNLTAVRTPEGIQTRHFLDSLTCLLVTGELNGRRLVDIGTGAGFPGLPLKIMQPGLAVTLVESVGKKATFLQAVVDELQLESVEIVNARAEDLGQDPAHRAHYDWAVARAVAPLPVLLEYLLPFCRVGGVALAQKGAQAASELVEADRALAVLGGGAVKLTEVSLAGQENEAVLISVEKIRATPGEYPRRAGLPAKRPL
jgi:16S rRNA (guanine527-N7)-methyltransferase